MRSFIICVPSKYFKGIKLRHMRWPGYVVLIRDMRNEQKMLSENLKPLGTLSVNCRVLLKCTLSGSKIVVWTRFT
jgi:hypothetical protein